VTFYVTSYYVLLVSDVNKARTVKAKAKCQGHFTMQRLKIKYETLNSFCFFPMDLGSVAYSKVPMVTK